MAIITGSRRGIGRAALRLFAGNGSDVIACSKTPDSHFEEECRILSDEKKVAVTPLYFDMADACQIKDAVAKIKNIAPNADILVNNAGIAHGGLFQMTSLNTVKDVFEVNFFSQLLFTQGIVRLMARRKKGAVINVASVAGLDGRSGTIAYGSSKSALILATKTMARELAPSGIRVNTVAPGIIKTDMFDSMEDKAKDELIRSNALNRYGEPVEIANVILFLASDMSSYMTGQTLRVDGGL
jgi:3-oxoacyl-[acyl-carrier protein] reductase